LKSLSGFRAESRPSELTNDRERWLQAALARAQAEAEANEEALEAELSGVREEALAATVRQRQAEALKCAPFCIVAPQGRCSVCFELRCSLGDMYGITYIQR